MSIEEIREKVSKIIYKVYRCGMEQGANKASTYSPDDGTDELLALIAQPDTKAIEEKAVRDFVDFVVKRGISVVVDSERVREAFRGELNRFLSQKEKE